MHRLSYLLIALVLLLGCNSPFIKMDATPTAKVAPLTLSSGSAGNITPNFRPTMGSLQTPSALPASGECLGEQVFNRPFIRRLQSPLWVDDENMIGYYYPGVTQADFAVEATFEVPNTPTYRYGFTFREFPTIVATHQYERYSLWVSHERKLTLRGGEGSQEIPLAYPYVGYTDPGAKNTLRMVAVGGQGWVSINGNIVMGSLDLSDNINTGEIALGFSTYPKDLFGDGFTSATLTLWNINRNGTGCTSVDGWTDFLTAPIPPQERPNRCLSTLHVSAYSSDTLPSDEKNYLVRAALGYPRRDFVLQADFYYLNVLRYQYGFSFRYLDNNADEWEEYRLWINSDRTWQLERYPGRDGETPVQTGSLPPEIDLNTWHEVRLIAVGGQGWFFIDNILISALDLSDITVAGGMALLRQADQVITTPPIAYYIGFWDVNSSASNCDSLDTWLAEFEK